MAITASPYGQFLTDLFSGVHAFNTDTYKIALLTNAYSKNLEFDTLWSDVSAKEITSGGSTGYTAGGLALTGVVPYYNGTVLTVYADDADWAGLTATFRYAVVYQATNTKLVGLFDFGTDRTNTSELLSLTFNDGLITVTPV